MSKKIHRISVKAVIVKNSRLLLIRKTGSDGEYFILPGGGQDHGESLAETLVREVREETGYAARPQDILFVRDYIGANHEYAAKAKYRHQVEVFFEATLTNAKPKRPTHPDTGQLAAEWVPLKDLPRIRVYPSFLRSFRGIRSLQKIYLGDVN